jgi:hypothetical protein
VINRLLASTTGRKLAQQVSEPGAPPSVPSFARPSPAQPMPKAGQLSQVFSCYDSLPVGAHMLALEQQVQGIQVGFGTAEWTFTLPKKQGFVAVVRGIMILPIPNDGIGTRESTFYFNAAPSTLQFKLLRNGQTAIDTGSVEGSSFNRVASMGQLYPVYLVGGENDSIGFVVRSSGPLQVTFPHSTIRDLTAVFFGEYLRSRNLPPELETGHDAPLVHLMGGRA